MESEANDLENIEKQTESLQNETISPATTIKRKRLKRLTESKEIISKKMSIIWLFVIG